MVQTANVPDPAIPGRFISCTDDPQNLVRTSDGNGVTWSEPTDITAVCRDMADPNWRCTVVGPGGGVQDSEDGSICLLWERADYRFITFTRLDRAFLTG